MARRFVVLVAAVLALLTGCQVDVQVDLDVRRDGSGTLTVTATADAELVDQAPGLAEDLRFDDLTATGWTVDGPTPTDDGGLRVVLSQDFDTPAEATAILDELSGDAGPFVGVSLTRDQAFARTTWHLDGALQVTGGLDAFADADALAALGASPYAADLAARDLQPGDALSITFDAALPGSVEETTGQATDDDGRNVLRWSVPFDSTAQALTTRTEQRDSGARAARTIADVVQFVLIGWIVVAATFITYVVIARRRRRTR